MDQLLRQLEQAGTGHGGVVMVSGEPGIGKTRLAEELTAVATEGGARVVWARCWEGDGTPAFWPWAQVMRELFAEGTESLALPADLVREVAQIVPELAGGVQPSPPASGVSGDPSAGRFRLFQAAAAVLTGSARSEPLVVVLDDLHWAGHPSLALLHFIARGIRNSKLLVVGTYRDVEIGPHHPLRDVFGQLVRDTTRVPLVGLSQDDVGAVMEAARGVRPSRALAAALHRHTDGNPFFVSEVVRLGVAEGLTLSAEGARPWNLTIPHSVREMIGGQLERVSRTCAGVLEKAAVVGREFDADLLARVTAIPDHEILDILHEAGAANLIAEDREVPGRFCFTHVLVRESIYDELSPAERVATHLSIGKAIEETAPAPPARNLAMLAYHFFQAVPTSVEALVHTIRAGDHAYACLAHEEAVRYYERALEILEWRGGDDRGQRCELLLALGEARSKAADAEGAKRAFKAAAAEARFVRSPELLARAAIGYGGRFPGMSTGVVNRILVALLEESLAEVAECDSPLRATLLARLSRALFYEPDQRRRIKLSDEATAMARRLDDPPSLVAALNGRYWALTGADQIQDRLAAAKEMTGLAISIGDVEMALQGHNWTLIVLAELGDMAGVDLEILQHGALCREPNQPLYLWLSAQFQAMRALMCGRFDDAERWTREALDVGQSIATSVPVREVFLAQCLNLHLERGELEEAKLFAETRGLTGGANAFTAMHLCRLGRDSDARAELAVAMQRDLTRSPRDTIWLGAVATLAEVAARLEDRAAAERIYPVLLPYAEYNVMVSPLMCKGSASHFLALLAAADGRSDDAERHIEKGLELNTRMGARPLVARTQYEYARILAARSDPKARDRAERLLADAVPNAAALGMAKLLEECTELQTTLAKTPPAVATSAATCPVQANRFEQVGDFWEVRFDGVSVRIRDSKGMRYLAELLTHPGQEFHVADLAGARGADRGSGTEILDSRAKAEYRVRIVDLEQSIADAETLNDAGRLGVLTEELNFITDELASAYGLGGRTRRTADTTERMRKAITNRIRAAVKAMAGHHPRLGQHLSNSVRTGVYCSYVPEIPTSWNHSNAAI